MRDQTLFVCGIELLSWQRETHGTYEDLFFRYCLASGQVRGLQKVAICRKKNGERWFTNFWDELDSLRNYGEMKRLDANLSKKEVMERMDEFLLRMDRLRSFE